MRMKLNWLWVPIHQMIGLSHSGTLGRSVPLPPMCGCLGVTSKRKVLSVAMTGGWTWRQKNPTRTPVTSDKLVFVRRGAQG